MPPVSVNDLMKRSPTFVAGTAGDVFEDRRIRVQIDLVRGMALPKAPVIEDGAIARDGWPKTPVLYGTTDSNAALAAISARLPFRVTRKAIEIGGETFSGPGYRLIAAIPADGERPEMALFAGTGTLGIAEINSLSPGEAPILVADTFGPLVTGRWVRKGAELAVVLGERRRRIEYRNVNRKLAIGSANFLFPEMVPPRDDEAKIIAAAERGLATLVKRLDLADLIVAIYVYPDRRSKQSLTGNAGDGHAVPSSRALHIIGAPGPALESLVAHEATHVVTHYAWGPAGTALMGEGLAVWVAGGYQGTSLQAWAKKLEMIPVAELLGTGWRKIPEDRKYPLAGLLVKVAISQVGRAAFREHLYGATVETWEQACLAAGISAAALETKLREALQRE